MNVKQLLSVNIYSEVRFYEETDIDEAYSIDEYTPYKTSNQVDFNREVSYLCSTVETFLETYEGNWISVILKEEENAEV